MRIVLASGNPGKQREFAALMTPLGHSLLLQSDFNVPPIEETGASFAANALLKAAHAAAHTGLAALADDSGLEVDALGGRPGVHSARFAGVGADDAANNHKLLTELAAVADGARTARYRCVLALVRGPADPAPLFADGSWEGHIAPAPRGNGGFGYDPLFIPAGLELTCAELDAGHKQRLSHRGQAARSLLTRLGAWR
jgi:XTP/dITP diphosphohydrolase